MKARHACFAFLALAAPMMGCKGGGTEKPAGSYDDAGAVVSLDWTDAQRAELDALRAQQAAAATMTAADFAARHGVAFSSALGYDPRTAAGLGALAGTAFALTPAEEAKLGAQGFVLPQGVSFPTFGYGYDTVFLHDLPVYITADALLFAVHRSYDAILLTLEQELLVPTLDRMLEGMRARLASGVLSGAAAADADLYLAVALSLLRGSPAPVVAGGDVAAVRGFVAKAVAAQGTASVKLFGATREEDFSQFKPRGHYTDTPALERYFRSMMWLGRVDFRLLETQSDGTQIFRRRQLEAAFGLRALLDETGTAAWKRIEEVLSVFLGEQDFMTLPTLDAMGASIGTASPTALAGVADDVLLAALRQHGLGSQRIASQLIVNDTSGDKPLPLSVSFTLLGQRYTLDSHVLANVSYGRTKAKRMMPSPLDVGFAVFRNPVTVPLLAPELETYQYAPQLQAVRTLAEAHGDAYDTSSLTRLWQASVRALSPRADELDAKAKGLPAVTATEPWARRMLGTQLASWAELRHDTILYTKQSYTDGAACEFPDAYVDPYPAFYERLGAFAAKGRLLVEGVTAGADVPSQLRILGFFDNLATVARRLGAMATKQRKGEPFSSEELAYVNEMVRSHAGCAGPSFLGWYAQLFYEHDVGTFDPTIADVHTQPTDEAGNTVGRILHVGTGYARPLVTTVDTCVGPRVYVGIVSSYHEVVTEQFERYDDTEWSTIVKGKEAVAPSWLTTLGR